ncbi:MAG TPA: DUF4350 domain-containing protein [Candidatus Thermoplasmatota archaeon]|nr:DUF4350 domain-containing protein [Candidatus Thermoplasmatota archaeon]
MNSAMKGVYQFLILGGIGVLLFVLALATPMVQNTSEFSMYNAGWNGCSNIAVKTYTEGKFQPTFTVDTNELTLSPKSFVEYPLDPKNATILIVGPRSEFSSREADYLQGFLKKGGMVLLADDFGTGNDLLVQLNTTARFTGDLLLDLSFEKKPSFVTIFDFPKPSHPVLRNVSHILLNYATSISTGKNTSVLAVSSQLSWRDTNLNGKEDAGEENGPFPVLATERYGNGTIVLLSDPSVLINSMKNQLDNAVFRENLLQYLFLDRGTVIIDESHRQDPLLLHIFYTIPANLGAMEKVAIVLLVIGAFLVGFTKIPSYIVQKVIQLIVKEEKPAEKTSAEKMIEELLTRHPSWSGKKLKGLVRELKE